MLDRFGFDSGLHGIAMFARRVRLLGHEPATAIFESTGNHWNVLHGEPKTALEPVPVNPHDLKIIAPARFKDYNRDSEGPSDPAGSDFYKPSCMPSEKMDLRETVRTRLGFRYDAAKRENRVHAIPVKYPLKRPACLCTAKSRERLRAAPVRDCDRMALDAHPAVLDVVEQRISLYQKGRSAA